MSVTEIIICNMAISRLGKYGTVSNIRTNPTTEPEKACALFFDQSRKEAIKLLMPNFALARRVCAVLDETPPFGWTYSYEYPSDCLKVLGIGEVEEKKNDYAIEGNRIYTNEDYEDGLELRYIKDISDTSKFSPEFVTYLTWHLAYNICMTVTKSMEKVTFMEKILPKKLYNVAALNAQENKPIRINNSKFKSARRNYTPSFEEKA